MNRSPAASSPSSRVLALVTATAALAASVLLAAAGPVLAHAGEDAHTHGGLSGFEDAVFLDPLIWDGASSVDCRIAGEGTIVWTLTGSAGVEYAELHIDEPERTVTAKTGGPYVWISPLYALDGIEADVDRIVGTLDDDARFTAVTCPEGGDMTAVPTPATTPTESAEPAEPPEPATDGTTGLLLPVGGGVLAGAALGLVVGSRRRTSAPA